MGHDLNIKATTANLLEENHCTLRVGKDFLAGKNPTNHKRKKNCKQDFIKIKNICSPKIIINKMNMQPQA